MPIADDLAAGAELADAITSTGEATVFLTVRPQGIKIHVDDATGKVCLEYATWDRLAKSKAPITPRLIEKALGRLSE